MIFDAEVSLNRETDKAICLNIDRDFTGRRSTDKVLWLPKSAIEIAHRFDNPEVVAMKGWFIRQLSVRQRTWLGV